MARVFITGAETGDLSPWSFWRDAIVVPARSGMTGNYCINTTSAKISAYVMKKLPGDLSEVYLSMLIRREETATWAPVIMNFLSSTGTEAFALYLDTTNYYLQCRTNKDGTTFANSTPNTFAINTTYRMEIYFKPSTGSDGRLTIKMNGTIWIDYTGVTSTQSSVRYLGFGNTHSHSFSSAIFYYDDIIVDDADWIVDTGEQGHKVAALIPTGAGAASDLAVVAPAHINDDKARWLFESGALGTDERGNAGLTLYGSPAADTGDKRQGASSIRLVKTSNQYGKVLDSALPSGFPLKSGEANRTFTLCFWVKFDTATISVAGGIFHKHVTGSDCGWGIHNNNLQLAIYYATTATAYAVWNVFTFTIDKWYFIAVKVNGVLDESFQTAEVYDLDAGTWTTYPGVVDGEELRISGDDLYIGSKTAGGSPLDGWLDDMRIYPYILSHPVLDLIRQGRDTFYPFETTSFIPPYDCDSCIQGSVNNNIHTFQMSNLVGSVEAIKCVSLCVRNFLTGTPSVKNVTPVVRIGDTNYLGASAQAPTWHKPQGNTKLWELSPATTAPWTKDELEAAEFGLKLTT